MTSENKQYKQIKANIHESINELQVTLKKIKNTLNNFGQSYFSKINKKKQYQSNV